MIQLIFAFHYQIFFVFSAAISCFFICRHLARHPHLISDIPNLRSSHKRTVSRGGGISLFLPCIIFFIFLFWPIANPITQTIVIGSLFFAFIGTIDDHQSISPVIRLVISFIISIILCFYSLDNTLTFFGISFSGWPVRVFQVLWIVSCINFFNFMDGIDGLAALQAWWIAILVSLTAYLGFYELISSQNPKLTSLYPAIALFKTIFWTYLLLAGTLSAFLYWNWPRAHVFMGDGGSYFLGFMLGYAALFSSQMVKATNLLPDNGVGGGPPRPNIFDTGIIFTAWVPFYLDAIITLILRLKKKQNIFCAHRGHLYQKFLNRGMKEIKILFFYSSLNVFLIIPITVWAVLRSSALSFSLETFFLTLYFIIFWKSHKSS